MPPWPTPRRPCRNRAQAPDSPGTPSRVHSANTHKHACAHTRPLRAGATWQPRPAAEAPPPALPTPPSTPVSSQGPPPVQSERSWASSGIGHRGPGSPRPCGPPGDSPGHLKGDWAATGQAHGPEWPPRAGRGGRAALIHENPPAFSPPPRAPCPFQPVPSVQCVLGAPKPSVTPRSRCPAQLSGGRQPVVST